LIDKKRGVGSTLSPLGEKLIWADRRIFARLAPTMDSLASELEVELQKVIGGKPAGVRLRASYAFAVAALHDVMKQRKIAHDLKYEASLEAVAGLAGGTCDIAGFHVPIGSFEKPAMAQYLNWLDPKKHMLIEIVTRSQGLFVARGNPKRIRHLSDLTRNGVRFVNRQSGSGTRMLLDLMLKQKKISSKKIAGYETSEFTHSAIAAYIASDMADVGFGVETAARLFKLDFVPFAKERYFLACEKTQLALPQVQEIIHIVQSAPFKSAVRDIPGLTCNALGKVKTMEEAFPHSLK
ncbi:MAG: substrate-binding domain-containing protein, partial [Betaproteobacteria bacterium]